MPLLTPRPQQISTRANLVPVPTLVLNEHGHTIFGLHEQNFIIEDDGVEQVVHLDEPADPKALSMIVAVQCGRRANRELGRVAGLSAMLDSILNGPNSEEEEAICSAVRSSNLDWSFDHARPRECKERRRL